MMDKNLEQLSSAIQLVSSGREWLTTDKDQAACDRCLEIAIKRLEGFYADNHALISAAPAILEQLRKAEKLIADLNYAFYVKGTSKALQPVMAETKPLLASIREAIKQAG